MLQTNRLRAARATLLLPALLVGPTIGSAVLPLMDPTLIALASAHKQEIKKVVGRKVASAAKATPHKVKRSTAVAPSSEKENLTTPAPLQQRILLAEAPAEAGGQSTTSNNEEPAQVQLNIWAIQIAGKRGEELTRNLRDVNKTISEVQDVVTLVPYLWADSLRQQTTPSDLYKDNPKGNLGFNQYVLKGLHDLKFDIRTDRQLSLAETVILTGAADYKIRNEIIAALEGALSKQAQKFGIKSVTLTNLRNTFNAPKTPDQATLDAANRAIKVEHNTFRHVLRSLKEASPKELKPLPSEEKDERLATRRDYSFRGSKLFREVLEFSLAKDMEALVLEPLMEYINRPTSSKTNGVSFIGQNHLVASARKPTGLGGKMAGYLNTAPPPTVPLENIIKARVEPNPLAQLELLAPQPQPIFTNIAPGISINATATPALSGTDIFMEFTFKAGTETTILNQGTDPLTTPPANAIKEQTVTTNARVDGFNLFTLSSMANTATHPRPRGYIPILGTLPIIGRVFQWNRKAQQIDYHSIVLINAVILPRATDIADFYGHQYVNLKFQFDLPDPDLP